MHDCTVEWRHTRPWLDEPARARCRAVCSCGWEGREYNVDGVEIAEADAVDHVHEHSLAT
jgi:hypothetical protein